MVAVLGEDDAPNDPHWRVPHKDPAWGTFHRVRFRALPLCDRCGGTGEGVAVDEDCWKCDGAGMIENPDEK